MNSKQLTRFATKWFALGIGLAAFSNATYAATTFIRYGRPTRSKGSKLSRREFVVGAITKPWEANPIFRGLAPDEFTKFEKPGYVKIAWTLRADAVGNVESVFRTETRAIATDVEARRKFRRYWSFFSPGITAIRSVMLPAVKAEAVRRFRANAV